jgi:hypothetical protein
VNNRYAIFDADRVLQYYFTTSDPAQLAANIPPGGGSALTEDTTEPGTARYDLAKRVVPIAPAPETPARALQRMLGTIDGERETRMMASLTDGGAKKWEYAEKGREVRDYRSLAGAIIAGLLLPLNIAGTRERFAWAMAEVDDTGDTLEVVITRYEGAMRRAQVSRKVAARAQTLKRQISAAAPVARAAIFDARTWPTA